MSNAIAFPPKRESAPARTTPALDLPGPRIWTPEDLSAFLRVGKSWVYKRTQASAEDPPPRCPGIGPLRFDTHDPRFQAWLARQLGYIDGSETNE